MLSYVHTHADSCDTARIFEKKWVRKIADVRMNQNLKNDALHSTFR